MSLTFYYWDNLELNVKKWFDTAIQQHLKNFLTTSYTLPQTLSIFYYLFWSHYIQTNPSNAFVFIFLMSSSPFLYLSLSHTHTLAHYLSKKLSLSVHLYLLISLSRISTFCLNLFSIISLFFLSLTHTHTLSVILSLTLCFIS